MAFIPIPNTVRVSLEFVLAGQTVVITISIGKGTAWTVAQMDQLEGDMFNWWTDNLKPIQTNDTTLTRINVLDLSSDSAPSISNVHTTGNSGSETGDPVANNVALCVSFATAQRGRSYRGRCYVPGIALAHTNTPTTWVSSFAVAIAAAFSVINAYMTVSGAKHVVASRYHNNAPRVTGVATDVISYFADTLFDSQRRRLAGRGV